MTAQKFTGLASDSRAVKPGFLFAALQGTHSNGAEFIADAVKRGASAILARPELATRVRTLGVRFIGDENPRARLAHLAADYFGAQPDIVAAVTGTNGKTSVSVFLRQIWTRLGIPAASLGTIGIVKPDGEIALRQTTPDPIEVHAQLAKLAEEGIDHLALEASSHGLDQYRLDGVRIAAAAFTNLTRDHLDYHVSFDAYLKAKFRLFTELMKPGGLAVINADADHANEFFHAAHGRELRTIAVGFAAPENEAIRILGHSHTGDAQNLTIECSIGGARSRHEVKLPLAGDFQASNALLAAGLAIGLGAEAPRVFKALGHLKGAPGRLEKVAYAKSGAAVYVDYAHTPDAVETVLKSLRPHVESGGKLRIVFGCGGDRDSGKRPLMGAVAERFADAAIVTDDNPRSEIAAGIRAQILKAAPSAREIADRVEAIRAGIDALGAGDILVIAGKGHETGQIVGNHVFPFSDREEAIRLAIELGGRAA